MKNLLLSLSLLCALPLSAMENKKEALVKEVNHTVDGYVKSAALGGFAGFQLGNIAVSTVLGATIVSIPMIATGASIGIGARYLYNKYHK